jgi:hypothetical protein
VNVSFTVTEQLVNASFGRFVFDRTFRWKRIETGKVMLIWPFWRFARAITATVPMVELRKAAE